jgi:hypothetical protein
MRHPVTRTVRYEFEGEFCESAVEKVLERAQRAGTVNQFDTGRGDCVWLTGRPGAELRAVRDEVGRIVRQGIVWDEKLGRWVPGAGT